MDKYLIENVNIEDVDFDHVNDDLPRYGEEFDYNGEKSNWCVYAHINKSNGKMYIGISSNLKHRWARDGENYKCCTLFYNAIQKYSFDGFYHVVLMNGLTSEQACIVEIEMIKKYDTLSINGKGYNLTEGGQSGYRLDYSTIKKKVYMYDVNGIYIMDFDSIRDAELLINNTQGARISSSLSRSGYAYGYLWSLDYHDRIDPYSPFKSDNYFPIIAFDPVSNTTTIYSSVYKISDDRDIRKKITKSCRKNHIKNYSYCSGIYYFYESDYSQELLDDLRTDYNEKIKHKNKPVYMFDKNDNYIKKYNSAYEAAEDINAFASNIIKVCNLNSGSVNGYYFSYNQNSGKNDGAVFRKKYAALDPNTNNIVKTFNTRKSAGEFLGLIYLRGITEACDGKRGIYHGYIWRYLDENDNIVEPSNNN